MPHRRLVLAQIVEQLAAGEVERNPVFVALPAIAQARQHLRQPRTVRLGAPAGADRTEIGRRLGRVQTDRMIKAATASSERPF